VKLVDVNLLLYAINADSARHDGARRWLEDALNGREPLAFSWAVLLAFVRLSTRARLFANPLSVEQALDLVDGWLGQPPSLIVHPTARHAAVLRRLLSAVGTGGNLTTDAHLAALAIEHGADLYSCDYDFARFPGLRWHDPLAE
jgi:uncharacterized protein